MAESALQSTGAGATSYKPVGGRPGGGGAGHKKQEASETPPPDAPRNDGQEMAPATLASMERGFGFDFSRVRIHTDSKSAESAASVRARAYTLGSDIVFGAGRFAPETADGKHLLAHELAHVVQQARGGFGNPMIQRGWLNPLHTAPVDDDTLNDEQKIEQTASASGNDVVSLYHYEKGRLVGKATDGQRIRMLQLLNGESWVGPEAEYAMEFIWNSFGKSIATVAEGPRGKAGKLLWDECIDQGAELHKIDAVTKLSEAFKTDTKAVADSHMQANLDACHREMEKLGLKAPEKGESSPTKDLEMDIHKQEIVRLMDEAKEGQAALDALCQLHVGWTVVKGGVWMKAPFNPEHRPNREDVEYLGERPPYKYDDILAKYNLTKQYLALKTSESPAVFAAVNQSRVDDYRGATTPEQAIEVVRQVLAKLDANIADTKRNLALDQLDYRSLHPIHQQMYGGAATGPSGTKWSGTVAKSVGQGVVSDHESEEMWSSLIVGLLAAGAFIAAEVFSGGLATPLLMGFAAGLSIGQAASSWSNYVTLASAAGAASGQQTRVATPEQATAALTTAVLDTVFAFLDVATPAWKAFKVIRLESQIGKALEKSLVTQAGRVAELMGKAETREQAAHIVEALIAERGVQGAMNETGKTAQELATLFGADSPIGKRLLEAGELGLRTPEKALTAAEIEAAEQARKTARAALATDEASRKFLESGPLSELLPQILGSVEKGVITRQIADHLVLEAVEKYGPKQALDMMGTSWAKLSTVLTNESAVAKRFLDWRKGIFEDMKRFAAEDLKNPIPDQGSSGAFKNDLDISFMGEHGAEDRAKMMQYIAARAGIDGQPSSLARYLHMELFTDPRRLRAYDALPGALREKLAREQTEYERKLIPNRDLYAARKAGDEELEKAILGQMQRDGVAEFAYKPLTSGEIERLAHELDAAHEALLAAVKAGDLPAQEAAAKKLGQTQALMNAAEEGGYFSGGSARRYVTDRAGSNPMDRLTPGRGLTALPTEDVGAMVDQLSKLNHAALELGKATSSDDIVAALRAIGKYGERAAEVAGGRGAGEAVWSQLADTCKALKQAADGKLAVQLLKESPDLTEAMARKLLNEVRESSMLALEKIRVSAGALGEANAKAITDATRNHALFLRIIDFSQYTIGAWARAARTGTVLIPGQLAPAPVPPQSGDFGPLPGQQPSKDAPT